ncbi:hypothetical protein CMI37_21140 [Candidatus Pacearchaeota archaeon]|nr:hypothetical protein [Candidatus Pacearchaeota archaeon]|tara:strand:+ start:142 stop:1014 length:873 start_codon:yes stop_codon:yes gene_type:complete
MDILSYVPFTKQWYGRRKENARELLSGEISMLKESGASAEQRCKELAVGRAGLEKSLAFQSDAARIAKEGERVAEEQNADLKARLAEDRTNRTALVAQAVGDYKAGAGRILDEIRAANKQNLLGIFKREIPHVDPALVIQRFPAEYIYQAVIEFLVHTNRAFGIGPVAVYAPRGQAVNLYYASATFRRCCSLSDDGIADMIKENLDEIRRARVKGHEVNCEGYDLTFRPLGAKDSGKVQAVAVYATPHKSPWKAIKALKGAGEGALGAVQDAVGDLGRIDPDLGENLATT